MRKHGNIISKYDFIFYINKITREYQWQARERNINRSKKFLYLWCSPGRDPRFTCECNSKAPNHRASSACCPANWKVTILFRWLLVSAFHFTNINVCLHFTQIFIPYILNNVFCFTLFSCVAYSWLIRKTYKKIEMKILFIELCCYSSCLNQF